MADGIQTTAAGRGDLASPAVGFQGLTISTRSRRLVSTDPGIELVIPIIKSPTLSGLGRFLLILLLAAFATHFLGRHRTRGHPSA